MTILGRFALPLAAALAVMAGWSWHMQQRGVVKARVRVEAIRKKISANSKQRREKVEKSSPSELAAALRRYCRDC